MGMNLTAFTLVVAAGCLHAIWNLAAKRLSGNIGVFWLGLWLVALVLVPLALLGNYEIVNATALPFMVATGLLHAVYFGLLAAAYRHGELSIVYPLARGTGVAGTGLAAWVLVGERISWVGHSASFVSAWVSCSWGCANGIDPAVRAPMSWLCCWD
jgi:multidrug transporter EmrE-like cation transporter